MQQISSTSRHEINLSTISAWDRPENSSGIVAISVLGHSILSLDILTHRMGDSTQLDGWPNEEEASSKQNGDNLETRGEEYFQSVIKKIFLFLYFFPTDALRLKIKPTTAYFVKINLLLLAFLFLALGFITVYDKLPHCCLSNFFTTNSARALFRCTGNNSSVN